MRSSQQKLLIFVYVSLMRLITSTLNACEDPKLGAKDLRLKLQRRGSTNEAAGENVSRADLQEKLSGIMHSQPGNSDVPKNRTVSDTKLVKRSSPEAATTEKKADNPPTVKNTKQKIKESCR